MVDVGSPPVFTWIVYNSTLTSLILAQVVAWRVSISILGAGPAVLRVQAAGQQNNDVGVLVQRILRYNGEWPAADERQPADLQANGLTQRLLKTTYLQSSSIWGYPP